MSIATTAEVRSETKESRHIARSVGAVLAGLFTVILITTATDTLMKATGVFSPFGTPMAESLFLLALFYRTIYGVAGGYVTARLASRRVVKQAVMLGIIGTVLGAAGTLATWNRGPEFGPQWYALMVIAVAIPSAWLGGKLRVRQLWNVHSPFTHTAKVGSADGTAIAFERIGRGPALILVDGALCSRTLGPSAGLAKILARDFTVFTYDRRGRGESSDTAPYAVEREIEDLESLIDEAGGSAFVWGVSSGAALALEAATRLSGITKLALYEPPFIVGGSRSPISRQDWDRIGDAIAAGQRGEAVKRFMALVGTPRFFVVLMSLLPVWSKLKSVAHTLPYDGTLVVKHQGGTSLPARLWASVSIPTLVIAGGNSPAWLQHAAQALANVLPNAQHQTLQGETHMLKARVHAPVLAAFFKE